MDDSSFFASAFEGLTGYAPLRWQRRLFEKMVVGDIPEIIDLPTGLGKTSVIPIWLIAFAAAARKNQSVPRRLVYIVNRRTVVDQATVVAEQIRSRLCACGTDDVLNEMNSILNHVRSDQSGETIAISTLRGELADNGEWKKDPARVSIIIGTIDMIGSKLLFSGYGDGISMRPHHAGLMGQDTLIVHDEAHLTPAFSALLSSINKEQELCREQRPVRIMELSATTSNTGKTFTLEPSDEDDSVVIQRLNARKLIYWHPSEAKELAKTIVGLALKYQDTASKVLIYVRTPDIAKEIVRKIKLALGSKKSECVALLTGTIRGYERDKLVHDNPVFQALLNHEAKVKQSVFLVSTSAGEVGIDLYADHIVCDLAPLDSTIQRLGRVNRRGSNRTACIDIVFKKDDGKARKQFEEACVKTKIVLEKLCAGEVNDASPCALRKLLADLSPEEKIQAFAPVPDKVLPTDMIFDDWSLTSIQKPTPSKPEIAPYLHGVSSGEAPETYVVWRLETNILARSNCSDSILTQWFKHCHIKSCERAKEHTDRVEKFFKQLEKRENSDKIRFILIDKCGTATRFGLQEIPDLKYATLVIPAEIGTLSVEGILDNSAKTSAKDVAEHAGGQERFILSAEDDVFVCRRLGDDAIVMEDASVEDLAAKTARQYGKSVAQVIPLNESSDTDASKYLLLVKQNATLNGTCGECSTIEEHTMSVCDWARKIAKALNLPEFEAEALAAAATWHDEGKRRAIWQRAIHNTDVQVKLAKSGRRGMASHVLGGYRHEFGSLLDATAYQDIVQAQNADLVLHLISSHHGRARPHFEEEAWDSEHPTKENEAASNEAMRRFCRLQQHYGRWGLAWLESLLRCADILASLGKEV